MGLWNTTGPFSSRWWRRQQERGAGEGAAEGAGDGVADGAADAAGNSKVLTKLPSAAWMCPPIKVPSHTNSTACTSDRPVGWLET